MIIDPELQYDAAQMAKLLESPEWKVYLKYLNRHMEGSLAQMMNANISDQGTHHFRGVYTACVDHARIPDDVIQLEHDKRGVE